jgi:hypothetical protein
MQTIATREEWNRNLVQGCVSETVERHTEGAQWGDTMQLERT